MATFRESFGRFSLGVVFGLFCSILTSWVEASERDFYPFAAAHSTEARMTFDYRVEFSTTKVVDEDFARDKIESQINHLFGPMGEGEFKAVPRGDHRISRIEVSKKPKSPRTYSVTYSYSGTIVLENGVGSSFQVILPINPDKIFKAGLVRSENGETHNPCSDPHYQTEGDFWYFWNPSRFGCPLREGIDYESVPVKVKRLANTEKSYPEYERLVDSTGTITISILMGMDDPDLDRDPLISTDLNAVNYRGIRDALKGELGFSSRVLSEDELRSVLGGTESVPYVEEFTKKTPRAIFKIKLFFGPSGISEESEAFHHFYRDALKSSSVMIYDGHSGLGGHLDLEALEETRGYPFTPARDRYQIYYFNSCSSYTYYNSLYFKRKASASDRRGTKNLDIMTNGLATYFSVLGETDLVLIRAIHAWANGQSKKSYQEMAREIDSDNLFGVNGDEDNPSEAVTSE